MNSQLAAMLRAFTLLLVCGSAACASSGGGASGGGHESADEAETIFGDAVAFTAVGMGMAVAVDGGERRGMQDGYVDQLFLLQQSEPSRTEPRLLRAVELFHADGVLLVRRADAPPLVFAVQIPGRPDPALGWLGSRANAGERFAGVELFSYTGAWNIPLRDVPSVSIATLLRPAPPPFSTIAP
jgi:hypothetical protein